MNVASLRAAAVGAGLLLAAVLGACGVPAPQATPETTVPSAGTATATPSAETKAFTFTVEKLSLRYPAHWTVKTNSFPYGTVTAETAAFADPAGKVLLTATVNVSSYDYAWPVQRTVIESGELPGLASGPWAPALKFAYYAEEAQGGGGPGAICTVSVLQEVPKDGPGMLRGLPPGGPTPVPPPSTPAVPSPEPTDKAMPYFIGFELGQETEQCGSIAGARAWWASPEGLQVKAVLFSLTAG